MTDKIDEMTDTSSLARKNIKVDPLDDFDEYVNGDWIRTTRIPDDQHDWGTFNILHEENVEKIKLILEQFSSDSNHKFHALGKFYKACLMSDRKSDIVIKHKIFEYLNLIDIGKDVKDMGTLMGFLTKVGIGTFFDVSASEDPKNTTMVKLTLSNVGLSLPEKDYYLDKKFDHYVTDFKEVVAKIFEYFEYTQDDALNCASDVFMIEELIARILKPAAERREFDKLYFKTSTTGFIDIMTSTDDKIFQPPNGEELHRRKIINDMWENFFNTSELTHINDLIAFDLGYFRKITMLLQMVPISKIKNYMKYLIMRDLGGLMIDDLDHIMFDFFGKKLQGQPAMLPRSTRIVEHLGAFAGEILGKEYVEQFSDPESLNIVKSMIANIQVQMKLSIENSTWLEDATKQKALKKLKTFNTKIGHPEVWRDHSALIVDLNNVSSDISVHTISDVQEPLTDPLALFNMNICMRLYDYKINITDVVDKPQDPNKWSMSAYEVNAYYDPQRNEIVFPAGIIQKPFFDKNQSIFKNYGAIGFIIGHEIIHGYDDQGRKYDDQGNIVNWWTDDDLIKFNKIADKMKDQYSEYSINGHHVNGSLTLGENLADLGGITLALKAVDVEADAKGLSGKMMQDPTQDVKNKREFFTSFANIWKKIVRPEKILARLLSDPHSPGKYRIFILRNIDEFYQAYDTKENTKYGKKSHRKMFLDPQMRIRMW